MGNPFFRFKQFEIWHDRCAMKVGTDGVLLGAWTDVSHSQNVLDIGTRYRKRSDSVDDSSALSC